METALLAMLDELDKEKYEVDVLLVETEGEFLCRSVCEICPEISGNRCASEGCRDLYRDVRDHGVIH